MNKPKILSGDELVARGTTKTDGSLPELGLKDVIPNGSWLEQKQVQSALDARKHLIEVERIEKCGVLSQAEWREELMLAEVTQKVGGHWQYVGHNVGKQLFLKPEEALYLIEVNCLQLKHNEVTVSLQQAYSLLLRGKISLYQYKVYASLSRLGYKVFRHEGSKPTECEKRVNLEVQDNKLDGSESTPVEIVRNNIEGNKEEDASVMEVDVGETDSEKVMKGDINNEFVLQTSMEINTKDVAMEVESEKSIDLIENSDDAVITENPVIDKCPKKLDTDTFNAKGDSVNECLDVNVSQKSVETINVDSTNSNVQKDDKVHSEQHTSESENNCVMEIDSENNIQNYNKSSDANNSIEPVESEKIDSANSNKQIDESISINQHNSESEKGCLIEIESEPEVALVNSLSESSDANVSKNTALKNNMEPVHSTKNINANVPIIQDNSESDKISVIEVDSENDIAIERSISECSDTNIPNKAYNLQSTNSNTKMHDSIQLNQNSKLQILENRKLRPCDSKSLQKCFENIPDLFQKQVVTVKIPEEQHIPKNVFLNNTTYVLKMENIKTKSKDLRPSSTDSRPYSTSEEMNGAHIRRVRDSFAGDMNQNNWTPPFSSQSRFPGPNFQFRPFNFWRPRPNMNFINFNMMFQRPFVPFVNFMPRLNLFPRSPLLRQFSNVANFNPNHNNNNDNSRNMTSNPRKRVRDKSKQIHFEAIKRLAVRLKQLVDMGITQAHNVQSLERLIQTYNTRYRTSLRLTEDYDIVNNETILETIELDCEDESRSKKPRTETTNDKYKENLNGLKHLALKLKELESKSNSSPRHRRAFSTIVKKFNKSYNADVYMNTNYEVFDRRHITLDSSSDSDCVIEETPVTPSGKKLRNPFNILKRLAEKQNSQFVCPSTSQNRQNGDDIVEQDKSYSEFLENTFDKNWLPNENDFGRAEVVSRKLMYKYLMDSKNEEYLYEFVKNQPYNLENWLDIKVSFLRNIAESVAEYENEIAMEEDTCGLTSIIGSKDCTDMPSVLEKLSIIKTNKEIATETSLDIDFDVYNRDVQNFRKTNRPKPHFRVICLNESTSFPSGSDVAALHSKYVDDVILFAVVSTSSIQYLQIKPTELPAYIHDSDDLT